MATPDEDVDKNEPDEDVKPWREISNSLSGKIYGTWKNLGCLEMSFIGSCHFPLTSDKVDFVLHSSYTVTPLVIFSVFGDKRSLSWQLSFFFF